MLDVAVAEIGLQRPGVVAPADRLLRREEARMTDHDIPDFVKNALSKADQHRIIEFITARNP